MFPNTRADKARFNSTPEDMASVSTFSTFGNTITTWGKASQGRPQSVNKQQEQQQPQGNGKSKNGKGSVIAVACMIIFLGLVAGSALSYLGFRAEKGGRVDEFVRGAFVTVSKIKDSFDEYVDTASLIHMRFRHRPIFNATAFDINPAGYTAEYMAWSKDFRRDFRDLYEYVQASDLKFKAMQFDPNITADEREIAELEAELYYSEYYPNVDYYGFKGFNGDSLSLNPRWLNQSFYFPIHYMEPIRGNMAAIDLDYYSSESRRRAVLDLFRLKGPSLTDRLALVAEPGAVSRCVSSDADFSSLPDQGPSFGVVLMHPGIRLSQDTNSSWPRDISSIVLCMSDLMQRSTDHQKRDISLYIHDLSHPKSPSTFMGGARLARNVTQRNIRDASYEMTLLHQLPLSALKCSKDETCYQRTIDIANRRWTVTILDEHGANKQRLFYIILVGLIVFIAFVCLAIWVLATDRRNRTYASLKAQAVAERNALVLENANRAAQTERELNDFLAHEVRNPLSAAMAATSFLRTELDRKSKSNRCLHSHFQDSDDEREDEKQEFASDCDRDKTDKTHYSPRLEQAREDVRVVDHALRFINELLRNMLDMSRASSGKLQVKFAPVDLLHDVLEPVAGMLHRGGEGRIGRSGKADEKVQIIVDCPGDIVVETDILRLKQVILNLGRNSVKFINEGFIRLRAEVLEVECDDDPSQFRDEFDSSFKRQHSDSLDIECSLSNVCKTVRIYVEDSGSGIPIEKQKTLFAKYQESLDLLSQGTGIGLHLCKNLVDLMGGHISLDNEYHSGIQDNPGARFVIDLQSAPLDTSVLGLPTTIEDVRDTSVRVNFSDEAKLDGGEGVLTEGNAQVVVDEALPELPKNLSILFVDDDRVLRKLFGRTIKMVAPGWSIREAANGETAILLAQEEKFDLIFCDMYMASVEKQLLGTETVAELRSNGVTSRICGLSANDKELEFLEAGANFFLFKPIPCETKILRKTLYRVLYEDYN